MIDWLACALVRAIGAVCCRLSPGVVVRVGEALGVVASWLQPTRMRIGANNLRAAFSGTLTPTQVRRILRACYAQLGAGMLELLRLPVMDRAYVERYLHVEHYDRFEAAVTSGRPVVLVTGHYGNWELCSIVAALTGHPIVALARAQQRFPRLYRLLVSYRESKGCTVIHKGGALRQLLRALDAGHPIGIVADQASRQGIFVEFFGRQALFATGPFELAYRTQAIIVPAFIHRVRGPTHRIVVERPIELSRQGSKEAAVREGIEQLARLLSQHIREEPSQWLWMHKRWKHTPARRVVVLSDGKLGHLRQSLAVAELLGAQRPDVSHAVVEVRYRNRLARLAALLWGWWAPRGWGAERCLALTLTPASSRALLGRSADLIISCGASTAPANLLWASATSAKSVVLLNPSPLPLQRFHLVIAPQHDALPQRRNVVQILGAFSRMEAERLRQASDRLRAHPNFRGSEDQARHHPVVALFLGGTTPHYAMTSAFAEALVSEVLRACEAVDGRCLVTTSRRTPPDVERLLVERLGRAPRCPLLLIASRDRLDLPAPPDGGAPACPATGVAADRQAGGTMEGMLGSADVAVVTGESISMVSEACASGRRVIVVEPPLRRPALTRHHRFLHTLLREGYVRLSQLPEVAHAITRLVAERTPAKPLDNLSPVRDALARLL